MENPNNDEKEQIPMRRHIVSYYVLVTAILLLAQVLNARFDVGIREQAANQPRHYDGQPCYVTYEDSSQLQHTTIVPTFDTPMPHGKNVIWCASFQMAWDRLAKNVLYGPVELTNSPECAPRLNAGTIEHGDLPENGCLAMAGRCSDGIVVRICDEMQRRLHRQPKFNLTNPDNCLVAYAYLEASIPFTMPYLSNCAQLIFRDSRGTTADVNCFGTHHAEFLRQQLRKQFQILYIKRDDEQQRHQYVIDPCRTSNPNQVVLACVQPAPTFEETWRQVQSLVSGFPAHLREPSIFDDLLVPEMAWDITHSFTELQEKWLCNKGFDRLFIAQALQAIRFRLDRNGADLRSEGFASVVLSDEGGEALAFDRPFFIFVKKRDGKKPFFAMYVDNAELLQKRKAEK